MVGEELWVVMDYVDAGSLTRIVEHLDIAKLVIVIGCNFNNNFMKFNFNLICYFYVRLYYLGLSFPPSLALSISLCLLQYSDFCHFSQRECSDITAFIITSLHNLFRMTGPFAYSTCFTLVNTHVLTSGVLMICTFPGRLHIKFLSGFLLRISLPLSLVVFRIIPVLIFTRN